ncbi:MAG: sensor histidine kinase [Butyricimonas paravirosa]
MVDINEMLRGLEMSYRQKIAKHPGIDISFTSHVNECVVYTEKNRVMQVISNFLNNALKFTSEGHIHFGYEEQANGLRFFVSDTGKGIPSEKQAEIFKRFVKLDSFTNGTGLGLAICQTIVRKLVRSGFFPRKAEVLSGLLYLLGREQLIATFPKYPTCFLA